MFRAYFAGDARGDALTVGDRLNRLRTGRLCDPGTAQRQPLSWVQSSSAHQNPSTDWGSCGGHRRGQTSGGT